MIPGLKGEQLWEEKTLELGGGIRDDAAYYVSGSSWVMDHTVIDTSDLNMMSVGDYTVKAVSPFNEYDYKIRVRDTVPPELDTGEGWKEVLCAGEEYDPAIIGASASDLSGITFIRYYQDGKEISSLCFDKASRPEIVIKAADASQNVTEKSVRLIVDTPPRFYGVHDQYLLLGSKAPDLDPVFACDDVDGGLTADIRRDISDVDFNNIGDYRIRYRVKDSYGLEADTYSTVHIVSSYQRVLSHRDDCRIRSDDLAFAVEEGYFTYEPFSKPDREGVIRECAPTLVNLYVDNDDGSSSSGSAFIYRVESDYIYMYSVYHVTSAIESKPVTITFYDGSSTRAAIRSTSLSAGNEAALFKIPVKTVPYHVLVRLKQVACEKDIYDHVKAGTPLMEYCKNWRRGEEPEIIKDVNVISFELSDIQRQYVDGGSYFTATRESVSGMSGTAVFDLRGVLAGICSKTIYPLESEIPKYRDGCDLLLKVDHLEELMERDGKLAN